MCLCVSFESNGFVADATIPYWLVIIGRTSLTVWLSEVRLGRVTSIMYGRVDYLGH
jgi:hypothetical protein